MTAVAHRLFGGTLAGAEPGLFGRGGLVFDRTEGCAPVRAVAKRLRLGPSAGAPPIALAGFEHGSRSGADRRSPALYFDRSLVVAAPFGRQPGLPARFGEFAHPQVVA